MVSDDRKLFIGELRDDPLGFSSLTELATPGVIGQCLTDQVVILIATKSIV